MIKSMTAYGRSTKKTPIGQWVFEIHSVNRRMLEINIHIPKEFLRFDIELRKEIAAAIQRGQITVRAHLLADGETKALFHTKARLLKELKQGWEELAEELGFDPEQAVDLKFLAEQLPAFSSKENVENETEILEVFKELCQEALQHLAQMKEREGAALAKDIEHRLKLIDENRQQIAALAHNAVDVYRDKLQERIREVCGSGDECDERILREVAIYAERLDITEELTRLDSHIQQFYALLASNEKSVGRTCDFLSQEFNREINTIASKSANSEIAKLTVKMKSELEKVREQIQNVE